MARPKRPSSPSRRDSAATKAVILASVPLLVAGALTIALASTNSPVGKWLRSFATSGTGAAGTRTRAMRDGLMRYARGEQPFSALRDAIVGSAKGAVKAVFGPPRTAGLGRGVNTLSVWRSDTWYYPLDRADRSAIAICFEGNVARDVEKISVPAASID